MNKKWVLALFAFVLIINVSPVLAATDIFSPIMTVFKGLDFGKYVNDPLYYPFIDAVIYFMLFISISPFALQKVFGDSKMVPITIGIILALSMCGFEAYYNWRLMVALSMYAFILVILIVGFFLYYVMHRATNHFWVPFGITVFLVVGLITSNASVREQVEKYEAVQAGIGITQAIAFFGLLFSTKGLFKGKNDGPNSLETADLKTYFPKGETEANNIENVDSELEKMTKDKGEKELLEEAKEETKLQEDSEVPIAEAKKTIDEVEAEKKIEEIRNVNEEKIMNKLISDSDIINGVLNRAGDPNVDKVMHDYIRKYLKEVSNVGVALEQNQKVTVKARLELLDNILENVKKIEDILKRTKKAENYVSYIEKQVAKDMGKEVLTYMENLVKKLKADKNNAILAWNQQIKEASEAKNGMVGQLQLQKKETIDKLNQNINLAEINKAKVKETVDNFIKIYTPAVEKTIDDIKKIVSEQIDFQQKLNKKVNDAFNDAKNYDIYINNLSGAIEKIGGVAYRIEKEDPNTTQVSELITKSQIAIEGMFLQISNINNLTIKLFSKDIKAILDDFQKLDIQSSKLGDSINGLTTSSKQVQQNYENLKKTANFEKAGQSDNISKILRAIDAMSKTSAQERQQIITQTINQISKTETDLNNELNKMIQENQRLTTAQTKVMDSLKKSLTTLTTIKERETSRIEQASDKMNAATAQAAQKIEAEDAALKKVEM